MRTYNCENDSYIWRCFALPSSKSIPIQTVDLSAYKWLYTINNVVYINSHHIKHVSAVDNSQDWGTNYPTQ